jgi:putative glutamine amidotransferase
MKHFKYCIFILSFLAIAISGCQHSEKPTILISKANVTIFQDWLSQADNNLDFINMYGISHDSIEYFLSHSSGMILSGGTDINPALYGKKDEIEKCEGIDDRRDTLEIRMIHYAMANKIPLLCICRGHQMLNVVNEGTLIPDIPSDYDTIINHRGKQSNHWVTLVPGTMLYGICRTAGDTVNSSHHQAVKDVAVSFRAVAFAEDGLVEAIELADTAVHPFILGVQWHPERMSFENPLAGPIAIQFIQEVRKFHLYN